MSGLEIGLLIGVVVAITFGTSLICYPFIVSKRKKKKKQGGKYGS